MNEREYELSRYEPPTEPHIVFCYTYDDVDAEQIHTLFCVAADWTGRVRLALPLRLLY